MNHPATPIILAMLTFAQLAAADHPIIRVGGSAADLPGHDGRAIQLAIDAAAARGGGTVLVAGGDYLLADALRMRAGVDVRGERGATRLRRGPLVWTKLASDADKSERHMVPADLAPWRAGMGVAIFDGKSKRWRHANKPLTITAIADGACRFADWISDDNIAEAEGTRAVNHFPMVLFDGVENAAIDGFDIDAAVADPDRVLAGMVCDAVYIWRSPGARVSHLTVRNAQTDGITTSSGSVGVVIEDCTVLDSRNFGIHPGSHSTDVLVQRCTIRGSGADGLWVCWGIRRGRFLDNLIIGNGTRLPRSGVCIGHKDTDCLFQGNRIIANRKHGIAFRDETEANGAHRAVIRDNIIEDNGALPEGVAGPALISGETPPAGIAIGPVHRDIIIEGNTIRETRSGAAATQRHAIWVAPPSSVVSLKDNVISGHPAAPIVGLEQK